MSEPLFKIGDVVALKSGGPPMTVWGVRLNQYMGKRPYPIVYDVNWFSGTELRRDGFVEPELVAVAVPEKTE